MGLGRCGKSGEIPNYKMIITEGGYGVSAEQCNRYVVAMGANWRIVTPETGVAAEAASGESVGMRSTVAIWNVVNVE